MHDISLSFFVLAFAAISFGALGVAGFDMEIGKILLVIFLTLSVIFSFIRIFNDRRQKQTT